jgi:hypothetical protein
MNFLKKIIKKFIPFVQKVNFLYFFYFYLYQRYRLKFINNINIINAYQWSTLKDKIYCFIPTYPSSGWHLTSNILNYYFNKQKFQRNFFTYKKENYYSSRRFKHDISELADLRGANSLFKEKIFDTYILHTHDEPNYIPYFTDKLIYSDKIIFLIRDPFSSIYSYNMKKRNHYNIKKNSEINFEIKDLHRYVNFYNSYHKFLLNKKTLIIYSEIYYKVKKLMKLYLKRVLNFFHSKMKNRGQIHNLKNIFLRD